MTSIFRVTSKMIWYILFWTGYVSLSVSYYFPTDVKNKTMLNRHRSKSHFFAPFYSIPWSIWGYWPFLYGVIEKFVFGVEHPAIFTAMFG
jgi:hypothetical protein